MLIHALFRSRSMLKAKPTTKLNRYIGTNFFLIIIRLKIRVP